SLLPVHAQFSSAPTDLLLAPVGGAAALGILAMFVIQTFTLPGGVHRFMTTAMFSVGSVIVATAAGWALLLRNKYEVANGMLGVERITGVTWLRSEEHTSELQSRFDLVCRLLLEKKKRK